MIQIVDPHDRTGSAHKLKMRRSLIFKFILGTITLFLDLECSMWFAHANAHLFIRREILAVTDSVTLCTF